ncbi:MAG: helix-turn-helix domain-containing protein [Chitinophagaceae bacterium]
MNNLGEAIKRKRQELGISAQQLAEILGVKLFRIYKWEGGAKPSDPEVWARLHEWLNLETEANQVNSTGSIKGSNIIERIIQQQNNLLEVLTKQSEALTVQSETANRILQRLTDKVEKKVESIDANLSGALAGVSSLALQVHSGRLVILQSLARLEKRPEDSLLKEADKIIEDRMEGVAGQ